MSQLETASIPLIGSLMQDIAMPIDPPQQWTIGRWAMKTAMVMEAVTRGHRKPFYTYVERQQIRSSLQLPGRTLVWLARYVGINFVSFFGTDVWNGVPESFGTAHGYVNTITVGRLAIQLLTLRVPSTWKDDRPIIIHPRNGAWETSLLCISPNVKTIQWPPRLTFSDIGRGVSFESLVKRWSLGEAL